MTRFSKREPRKGTESKAPAAEFFKACAKDQPGPWVLLVGGNALPATRIRLAESVIRFDERPSPWSHVALVLDLHPTDVMRSTGVEVLIRPPPSTGPERSYVSFFTLADYADDELYPNLAVVSFEAKERQTLADLIHANALRPTPTHEDRPIGPMLAAWAAYLYDPAHRPNPLLDNVPLPAAAYLDFVFAASGIDLTPSASTPAISPEHLWSTLRYFDHPTLTYKFATRRLESSPRTEALHDNDLAAGYKALVAKQAP